MISDLHSRERLPEKSQGTLQAPRGSASVHLDALRAIAAFSVLLYHWRGAFFVEISKVSKPGILTRFLYFLSGIGPQWVMVFFVLSGYLVGGSVLRAVQAGKWSWSDYLLTRMTRLYVVLLPALVLTAALDWVGFHLPAGHAVYIGNSAQDSVYFDFRSSTSFPIFLANAAFLQDLVLPGTGHMVSFFGSDVPLWSLSYEFWYYIAFPCAVLALVPMKSRRVRLAYGLALPLLGWFVGLRIAVCGLAWLMGVVVRSSPRFPELGLWPRRFAVGGAAGLLLLGLFVGQAITALAGDLLIGLCTALLMWVLLGGGSMTAPAWYARLSQHAARSSYTLYLVHLPMLIFLKTLFRLPQFAPTWRPILPMLGVMTLVLVYSQGVYWLFERNTDRLRVWLRSHLLSRPRRISQPVVQTTQ